MATLVVVCADECGDKLLSAELVSCSAEIVMSHYFFCLPALHLLWHMMLNLNVALVSSRVLFPEALWAKPFPFPFPFCRWLMIEIKGWRFCFCLLAAFSFAQGQQGGVSSLHQLPSQSVFHGTVPYLYSDWWSSCALPLLISPLLRFMPAQTLAWWYW